MLFKLTVLTTQPHRHSRNDESGKDARNKRGFTFHLFTVKTIRNSRRKRIVAILESMELTQKGKADVARRIVSLSREYDIRILTGTPNECRKLFPGTSVQRIPRPKSLGGTLLFYFSSCLVLPFLRYDLLFVAESSASPAALTSMGRPILCYGNTNPIQQTMYIRRNGHRIARTKSSIFELILGIALRKCDLIVVISPGLVGAFKSFGVQSTRIKVGGVGVPIHLFNPPNRSTDSREKIPRAVYDGAISLGRGIDVIIDGARIASRDGGVFRIRLIGCGEEERLLIHRLARDKETLGLLEIVPPIPYERIPMLLWESDFGISMLEPSVYCNASPPLKNLEFLAAGLPVIANRIDPNLQLLEDQRNALIIEYDSNSFARALLTLTKDERLRARLSHNALQDALEHSDTGPTNALLQTAKDLMASGKTARIHENDCE